MPNGRLKWDEEPPDLSHMLPYLTSMWPLIRTLIAAKWDTRYQVEDATVIDGQTSPSRLLGLLASSNQAASVTGIDTLIENATPVGHT